MAGRRHRIIGSHKSAQKPATEGVARAGRIDRMMGNGRNDGICWAVSRVHQDALGTKLEDDGGCTPAESSQLAERAEEIRFRVH